MQPRATREDYERALGGLHFPVSKPAVIRNARDHGGIDTEVYAVLDRLPDTPFDSFQDLVEAIRAVYRAGAREALPGEAPASEDASPPI